MRPEDPGERYKQEYLLMLDPALGRVPTERLAVANRAARAMRLSSQAAIQGAASAALVWEERGPNDVGGRTRAIMFDPNDAQHEEVWAGGVGGGLWYTDDITNAGEPWHNVNDFWANLAVTSMAYDPTNTMIFYVGTGEGYFNADALRGGGLFKSDDGGVTWNQLASTTGSSWTRVQDVVVTDQGTVLAATRDGAGVQRSDDGGASWTAVLYSGTGANTSRAADLEIAANGDIYAAMGLFSTDGVWKSDDDGVTWDKLNPGGNGFPTNGFYRIEIATAPSDSNRVYALTQDSATYGVGGFYQSDDAGATWSSLPKPNDSQYGSDFTRGQAWYDLILAVKPDDENVLMAGGINLFRGDSSGSAYNWQQVSHWTGSGYPYVHADQHAIVFRPGSPNAVVSGSDGGIAYTSDVTNNPPTWVDRNMGYNVTQFYSMAESPTSGSNLMVGGTQDNGTPKIDGSGVSGQLADVTSGDGAFTHINQTTNILGMASNQWLSWHRSLNGGNTFSYIGGLSTGGSFINPSDIDDEPDHLFFNYSSSAVGRLNNLTGGGSVTYSTFGPVGGFGSTVTHVRNSKYSPAATSTIYLGTSAGRIFRAEDAHAPPPGPPISPSWSELNTGPFPTGSISCIELGAGEDTLLVTFSNYGVSSVWYTVDGGANWDDLDAGSNLPDMPVWWVLLDPFDANKVYLGTEAGLWYTDDLTADPVVWSNDAGVPLTRVVTIRYRSSDHQVALATHGRGLWTTQLTAPPPPPPPPSPPALVAHLLLEGAYAGSGAMAVDASFESVRPLSQPYADSVFDGTSSEYDGSESVGAFPTGTIDWILVELRTDLSADSLVADSRRPAFVLQDGSVVGLDADTLRFPEIAAGSYHVVFRHRNHLAIITDSPIDFTAGPGEIDFRTSPAAANSQGAAAMKDLGDGYYAMFAADGNADGLITAPDFNAWNAATSAGLAGYVLEDFDMDSFVTAPDFNVWNANTTAGAASQVQE